MIPRNSKFPMRTEFFAWRKSAKIFQTPHLLIYSAPHTPTSVGSSLATSAKTDCGPRIALVISSKKVNSAVARNSLRRELYDKLLSLSVLRSQDLVVFLKSKASKEVLVSELLPLLHNSDPLIHV